ncbi:MAG: hypothetical protein KDE27_05300 [Planctomycetes bacterium]|nr:hypothetical protein [Planctomycetota bacterium]
MSHVLVSTVRRAAVALIAAALAFGLPEFLVLCTPDAGAPQVEFACHGTCCHHHHADAGAAAGIRPDTGETEPGPHTGIDAKGCSHGALGVELAPVPPRDASAPSPAPAFEPGSTPDLLRLDVLPSRHWRLATGPPRPRPARTLAVLRTTELHE